MRYGLLSHLLAFLPSPGHMACTHSLANNNITNCGKDMSAVIKLAEVLLNTNITSLKCAACNSAIWPSITLFSLCPFSML